jgi:hypothetical protein
MSLFPSLTLAVEMNGSTAAAASELVLANGNQTTTGTYGSVYVERPEASDADDEQPAADVSDGQAAGGVTARR